MTNMIQNAMLLTDGYKLGHKLMYPKGMTKLYSNLTPRSNKHFPDAQNGAVVFGIQYFVKKYLIDKFNEDFFYKTTEQVVSEYKEVLSGFLGPDVAGKIGTDHIAALHKLGYLPIKLKSLPEGMYCPIGVPMLTITSTHDDFAWLTNYLESLMSNALWKPVTSATMSDIFKRNLVQHAIKTGFYNPDDTSNIDFLCHDFSMRGMSGVEDAAASGMGHLASFNGTETVPALLAAAYYYNANFSDGGTIPATEHSIECSNAVNMSGDPDDEVYFKEMLDRFPDGFISIVSDGFDYWNVVGTIVPKYKNQIMARNGRVVIRPDSGDPVKIICGDPDAEDPIVRMGTYEFLLRTFGGTMNKAGYMELDPHIGLIYGDAITIKRQREIYRQLEAKGIAATNLVCGIGSFSFQLVTRDSLGIAVKSTYCEIDGVGKEIFKDPKTVVGMPKKSLRGLISVVSTDGGKVIAIDQVSPGMEAKEDVLNLPADYLMKDGTTVRIYEYLLKTVFENGELKNETTLAEIRQRLASHYHAAYMYGWDNSRVNNG